MWNYNRQVKYSNSYSMMNWHMNNNYWVGYINDKVYTLGWFDISFRNMEASYCIFFTESTPFPDL